MALFTDVLVKKKNQNRNSLTVWNWIVSSLFASSNAKKDLLWDMLAMSCHLQTKGTDHDWQTLIFKPCKMQLNYRSCFYSLAGTTLSNRLTKTMYEFKILTQILSCSSSLFLWYIIFERNMDIFPSEYC